jgi:acetyl esterase
MVANPHLLVLDPAAQAFLETIDASAHLNDLAPVRGREALNDTQKDTTDIAIDELWETIEGGPTGSLRVRVVMPHGWAVPLPAVVYVQGAGWVFGDAHTHDRRARELAVQSGAAVICPEYDLPPAAKYPTALEQVYTTATWVAHGGAGDRVDGSRVAVAGDSVGGNIAIALTFLALQRRQFHLAQVVAFCPATDAAFDTESYRLFAEGYFLRRDAMQWFWDQYTDEAERAQITASPLRAGIEDAAGFPPTLIITAEADVLRDEAEAFAAKLRAAGVAITAVRYEGMIHDFVVLNALKNTGAAKAATAQAARTLAAALRHR